MVKKPVLFASNEFKNRYFWEVVPDGAWKNKPCFIVGGGPSLKGFDWSKLKGRRTIAINRAFEDFEPTIIFSMDTRFLNWVFQDRYSTVSDGKHTKSKFESTKAYKVWLCTYVVGLPQEFFIVKVYKHYRAGLRAFTFSMKEGIGHGNNSGYGALNLAVCLQANPIYLLGFDCKHENGRSHYHAGHPEIQREDTVRNFIPYFERAAEILKPHGFKIINLNPYSALECFPKKRAEEVLH